MEEEAVKLIDAAVQAAGGYPNLVDRIAWKERTLKRIRAGELALSDKLKTALQRVIRDAAEKRIAAPPQKYGASSPASVKEAAISNVDPKPILLRMIPVYSFVQAGYATDFEMLPSEWEDEVAYYGKDPRAYGLRIIGDSMEPKYSPGDIAIVSPQYPATNGDKVVANIRDQGVLFKVMHHSGDNTRIRLTSYNPVYPELDIAREDFHWMHPVKQVIKT